MRERLDCWKLEWVNIGRSLVWSALRKERSKREIERIVSKFQVGLFQKKTSKGCFRNLWSSKHWYWK